MTPNKRRLTLRRIILSVTVSLYVMLGVVAIRTVVLNFWGIPSAHITAGLSNYGEWAFSLDVNTCDSFDSRDSVDIQFPRGVYRLIHSPTLFEKDTKPLSVTIFLDNGTYETYPLEASNAMSATTEQDTYGEFTFVVQTLSFVADELLIDFGQTSEITTTESICTASVSGDRNWNATWSMQDIHDPVSIETRPELGRSGQVITLTLKGLSSTVPISQAIVTIVNSSASPTSSLVIDVYSTEMLFGYVRDDQNPPASLQSAHISRGLILKNPAGRASLDYPNNPVSELNFTPISSQSLSRTMPFRSGSYGTTLALGVGSTGLRQDSIDHYFDVQKVDGALVIDGVTDSVVYQGNQFVKPQWTLMSPELQAAIMVTVFAVIGWFLRKYFPRLWESTKVELGDDGLQMPPPDSFVVVLASGRAVAGVLKHKPTFLNRKYVISNPWVFENNDKWLKAISSELSVPANQVEVTFVVDDKIILNPSKSVQKPKNVSQ